MLTLHKNDPINYDEKLAQLNDAWSKTYTHMASDFDFVSGGEGMWDANAWKARTSRSMPTLSIPLIQPYIERIVAPIRMHTPGMAVRCSDNKLQQGVNGVLRAIERASSATDTYSQALQCAVTCGLGWLRLAVETDPNTKMQVLRIRSTYDPTSIMIDPLSVNIDGSDAQYAVHHGYMDRTQAVRLHGERAGVRKATGNIGLGIPVTAVLDCTWYILEEGGCRITRTIGDEEVYNELIKGVTGLPVVPVKGEVIYDKSGRRFGGLVKKTRDLNSSINMTASNIMMLVALAPKSPWIISQAAINGHVDTWATSNTEPHAYLPWNHLDEDGNAVPQPVRLDNGAQTQGLQGVAEWMQDLLGRVTGISDGMLGGMESAMESGKSLIARMEAAESSFAVYIDHLTSSITQLTRVAIQMLPQVYDTMQVLGVVDDHGRSSRVQADLSAMLDSETLMELEAEVESGPAMEIQRKSASQALETMITTSGDKGILLLDLWAQNQNLPNEEEVLKRIKHMLPPELTQEERVDENGNPIGPDAQAMAAMQAAQEALQQKDSTIEYLQGQMAMLQGQVNNQTALIEVELQKANINAGVQLKKAAIDNATKKEIALITQGSEDGRLAAKLTADQQKQVNDFIAKLAMDSKATAENAKAEMLEQGSQQEHANLPGFVTHDQERGNKKALEAGLTLSE